MASQSSSSPAAKRRRIVGHSIYGSNTKDEVLSETETLRFEIPGFASLQHKSGEYIKLDSVTAHGLSWVLAVYPRGDEAEAAEMVPFYLRSLNANAVKPIKTKFSFQFSSSLPSSTVVLSTFKCPNIGNGIQRSRSTVLNHINDDGALIVDVHLQVYLEKKPVWYPKQNLYLEKNVISGKKLLESPEYSDVSFLVGDEEQETVHAHKCILLQRAPALYEFIKHVPPGDNIRLSNVSISTFRSVLEYVYTGSVLQFEGIDIASAKDILVVADRYNLVVLKLYLESEITSKLLNPRTAADLLSFADGHTCPLLKEACMGLYNDKNKAEIKESPGWAKLTESPDLLVELLDFTQRGIPSSSTDYDNMSVAMLREKLEALNLDLDGSRDMLVQRLKNHHSMDVSSPSNSEDEE